MDGKLPAGRPIVFMYDPAEGHTVKHYVALARSRHDLLGYPMCLANRKRVIAEISARWAKHFGHSLVQDALDCAA